MNNPPVRRLSRADTLNWEPIDGTTIFGGDLIHPLFGYQMSAMRWQLDIGALSDVAIPTDEAWIILTGEVAIRTRDHTGHASSGDVLLVPHGLPAVAEAIADTELITVAYPPSWELDERDWEAMRGNSARAERALTVPRQTGLDRPKGEAIAISTPATIGDPGLVVQHVHIGAAGSLTLPAATDDADEAVVVTHGVVECRTGAAAMTAEAGDLVYRPTRQVAQLQATDETELVIVRTSQRSRAL